MLEKLRKRLQQHTPQRLDHVALPEAAVLMPIVERPAPTLLFTRRASHLNTHRGQVAFPGGKREPGDADLYATALREAEEEIALAPGLVQPLGRLSDVISLHGIRVTPWVGIIPPIEDRSSFFLVLTCLQERCNQGILQIFLSSSQAP